MARQCSGTSAVGRSDSVVDGVQSAVRQRWRPHRVDGVTSRATAEGSLRRPPVPVPVPVPETPARVAVPRGRRPVGVVAPHPEVRDPPRPTRLVTEPVLVVPGRIPEPSDACPTGASESPPVSVPLVGSSKWPPRASPGDARSFPPRTPCPAPALPRIACHDHCGRQITTESAKPARAVTSRRAGGGRRSACPGRAPSRR